MALRTTTSVRAIGLAMALVACGSTADTAEDESDPTNVSASSASREQFGITRWDVQNSPSSIKGFDADDNASVILQHRRVEQDTSVLHEFALREVWGMEGSLDIDCPKMRGSVRFERCYGGR